MRTTEIMLQRYAHVFLNIKTRLLSLFFVGLFGACSAIASSQPSGIVSEQTLLLIDSTSRLAAQSRPVTSKPAGIGLYSLGAAPPDKEKPRGILPTPYIFTAGITSQSTSAGLALLIGSLQGKQNVHQLTVIVNTHSQSLTRELNVPLGHWAALGYSNNEFSVLRYPLSNTTPPPDLILSINDASEAVPDKNTSYYNNFNSALRLQDGKLFVRGVFRDEPFSTSLPPVEALDSFEISSWQNSPETALISIYRKDALKEHPKHFIYKRLEDKWIPLLLDGLYDESVITGRYVACRRQLDCVSIGSSPKDNLYGNWDVFDLKTEVLCTVFLGRDSLVLCEADKTLYARSSDVIVAFEVPTLAQTINFREICRSPEIYDCVGMFIPE